MGMIREGLMRALQRIPLNSVPTNVVGGLMANRLGLQVARYYWSNLGRWHHRPVSKDIAAYAETLDRDGILVIENFLSDSVFGELSAEADQIEKSASWIFHDATKELKTIAQGPAFRKYLADSAVINELVSAFTARKIIYPPKPYLWIHQRREDVESTRDMGSGTSHIVHADLFYPIFKVFFCLNDIDEGNGAFTYFKGSHRASTWRRHFEYRFSVEQFRLWGRPDGKEAVFDPTLMLAETEFVPTSMVAKANTLVLANTMGFHNRGDFTCNRPRRYAHLDFNYIEKPLYKILSKLPLKFG